MMDLSPHTSSAASRSQTPSHAYSLPPAHPRSIDLPTATDSLSNGSLAAGKKRKATGPSRGVANLTPEQLAKKRANDREAQRAIRKRTKAQIEALERQVQELTSQQPYQDLQEALRQKQAVQAENEEIRRRLGSVMAILHPILNSGSLLNGNGSITLNGTAASSAAAAAAAAAAIGSRPPPDPLGVWASSLESDMPSPPAGPLSDTSSQRRSSLSLEQTVRTPVSLESYAGSPQGMHSPSPSLSGPINSYRQNWPSQVNDNGLSACNPFDFQKRNLVHGLEFSGSGERLGLNFLLDSSRQVPKINELRLHAASPSQEVQHRYQNHLQMQIPPNLFDTSLPPFVIPVRNVEPTCPLDSILLNFLRGRQRQAAEGVSKGQLVGPPYPSVSSLLNPEKSDMSHPLSKVFTDIISKFPDIRDLPEKVAVVYVMFLLMRWQIYPTRENYDRLPEWITPRVSQLVTPHPAWMDYLPWPRMRDRMVASYADYDFGNWFIPYTTTLSINWPYADSDCLLAIPNSEEYVINPVFESHLRNLNNWSLGPAFAKHYPGLVDTCRVKTDPWDTATNGA
ncbi:hypothetical protein LOZ53_003636 [Ophidiomyces ophidiicola]|uniref:Uncharacterized protein n=1 Tax=Ophidiomyces ophidiicola TaxID=1387563 RepID=A0ACB8UZW3_9EURO|nr:uncharacterized protein LOZ57_002645 [Ophidiomyces ophidiicola]KAI1913642.1 hypothetical protein LOZ64_004073 [Ophidiomyces ophidiicola]KAI1948078.1 hypothetical protein LOZ62_002800 [Ophidiomyces ophidiicola]KAI1949271.1 hypothetical protein LOZ57_002645 [Ophidiomyces ophidiicola]KAI1955133.1 hypothetical protein LOZ59_004690 [Ophidiomyces ophidiicola]KAI1967552.1 hypothetical protein LOZ56_005551 [Ophidiomyces ophidiicola]